MIGELASVAVAMSVEQEVVVLGDAAHDVKVATRADFKVSDPSPHKIREAREIGSPLFLPKLTCIDTSKEIFCARPNFNMDFDLESLVNVEQSLVTLR